MHALRTLWFRNTWKWGKDQLKPALHLDQETGAIQAQPQELGTYWLDCEDGGSTLFTENQTHCQLLFNAPNGSPYVKDAFHRYLVGGEAGSAKPEIFRPQTTPLSKAPVPPAHQHSPNLRV